MNDEFRRGLAGLEALPDAAAGGAGVVDENAVWSALRRVIDPEIGLDIVTLGLVYQVDCANGTVGIRFSLTTRGCPLAEVITAGIREVVAALPGVREVATELVWEPVWNPGMIREGEW